MALGRHWEWRGFGKISESFRERWFSFDHATPELQSQNVVDRYLWVPGYGMNAKMRSGLAVGDCLKFKRLRARWNQLQLWHEDPEDIHCFPLQRSQLKWLADELHVKLPDPSNESVDFAEALKMFEQATPRVQVIEVHKHREARMWEDGTTKVLVEIAELTRPEVISSLCLESTLELTRWSPPEQTSAARESVKRAAEDLGVERETLQSMNYVDALTIWASGNRLGTD